MVAINHSSIRHSCDLVLLESPSLPRTIDHHRNDPFPLAWEAVGADAKSDASDQIVAGL